jgi:DNA-binding CsgD family transcriptional regulator
LALSTKLNLTPAEMRLVRKLIDGKSLRSAAEALGITYETARSRLKSIFQKTRTHRQAELVALLLRNPRART